MSSSNVYKNEISFVGMMPLTTTASISNALMNTVTTEGAAGQINSTMTVYRGEEA